MMGLAALIEESGLTLREVARRSGVSPQTISSIVSGRTHTIHGDCGRNLVVANRTAEEVRRMIVDKLGMSW